MSSEQNSGLFAPIEPYRHGLLPEEDGHAVYFEECGNPEGIPVIFLHGGPGSGCSPRHRQFFDPQKCRAILFDQRGCGRSTFENPLFMNETAYLIHDMERLRKLLNIEKWLVVGGSWGGGLALAYACQHPEVFSGAILRNTFLCRHSDLQWFFHDTKQLMPDAWNKLVEHVPVNFRSDICRYVCEKVLGSDKQSALSLALAWSDWESALMQRTSVSLTAKPLGEQDTDALIKKYRIQSHYLRHLCFFPVDGILPCLNNLKHIGIDLLQGRLDWICRPESSWDIHQQIAGSRLHWVDHAGHGLFEVPMVNSMMSTINARLMALQTK